MCCWSGKQPPPLQHRVADVSEKRAQLSSWVASSPDLSETVSSQVTCKFLQSDAGMEDFSDTELLGPVNMWMCIRCRWVSAENIQNKRKKLMSFCSVSWLLTLQVFEALKHILNNKESVKCHIITYSVSGLYIVMPSVSICSAKSWKYKKKNAQKCCWLAVFFFPQGWTQGEIHSDILCLVL